MPIYFYSKTDAYAEFSNFSAHGFGIEGVYWRTGSGKNRMGQILMDVRSILQAEEAD